jgi:hypothetical protein
VGGLWGAWPRRVAIAVLLLAIVAVLGACDFTTLTPARWGCGTHKYVINPARAPQGGVAAVHEAFRQLNEASAGRVRWTYAGTTTGNTARTDVVVVAWRPQYEVPQIMRPGAWAVGAPQPWPNDVKWTGGALFIDPRYTTDLGVVLHELGHIAGLGHVRDPKQVMYPNPRGKTHYMPGDAVGLLTMAMQCK